MLIIAILIQNFRLLRQQVILSKFKSNLTKKLTETLLKQQVLRCLPCIWSVPKHFIWYGRWSSGASVFWIWATTLSISYLSGSSSFSVGFRPTSCAVKSFTCRDARITGRGGAGSALSIKTSYHILFGLLKTIVCFPSLIDRNGPAATSASLYRRLGLSDEFSTLRKA